MGSVIDSIDCPYCNNDATSDYYYKTQEEFIHCRHCGYYKSITIKNRDKRFEDLNEDDWQILEIDKPFGAYRLKSISGVANEIGTLITEEDYEILKKRIFIDESQIEHFSISRFMNGNIVEQTIINKK